MGRFAVVTWREWTLFLTGIFAAGSLFLTWSSLSAGNAEIEGALQDLPASDVFRSGWNSGFFTWFSAILLLVAGLAAVSIGQKSTIRKSGFPQLCLVAAILAVALMALGWFLLTWQYGSEQRELFAQAGIAVNPGFGRYLGLLTALVFLSVSVLDIRAARQELRGPQGKPQR